VWGAGTPPASHRHPRRAPKRVPRGGALALAQVAIRSKCSARNAAAWVLGLRTRDAPAPPPGPGRPVCWRSDSACWCSSPDVRGGFLLLPYPTSPCSAVSRLSAICTAPPSPPRAPLRMLSECALGFTSHLQLQHQCYCRTEYTKPAAWV
jgi:hypothetical protein